MDSSHGYSSRQRHEASERMPRHHHLHGYAALVLSGGYIEAGDGGRIAAEPGDVLFHDAFDAHRDLFSAAGAEILNMPLSAVPPFAAGRCADPDAIARLAECNSVATSAALLEQTIECRAGLSDWPDLLAADLKRGPLRLAAWADEHRLAPATVSRGFRLAYGVSPQRYRLEVRASAAARSIARGAVIAEASFAMGFADQPHLSRTLRSLYGKTPRQLRPTVKCVQESGRRAG